MIFSNSKLEYKQNNWCRPGVTRDFSGIGHVGLCWTELIVTINSLSKTDSKMTESGRGVPGDWATLSDSSSIYYGPVIKWEQWNMHVYVRKKLNSYRLGVKKDTNFLLAIGIRGKFMHNMLI